MKKSLIIATSIAIGSVALSIALEPFIARILAKRFGLDFILSNDEEISSYGV